MEKTKMLKPANQQWIKAAGRVTALLISLVMLTACATSSVSTDKKESASDKDIVVERAEARWAAMLAMDLETAYTYYSPGFRSTASVVDFMFQQRSRRVKWESAEYLSHNCSGSSCKVKFKTGFKVQKAIPGMDTYHGSDDVEETWVKTQGEWWYVPPKG